jgi:hypothetical protein
MWCRSGSTAHRWHVGTPERGAAALRRALHRLREVLAHAVTEGDKGYIQEISGVLLLPFVYLGAKHMVTGYDHILFLFGVIFFLYRLKHIGIYVSLFALGHSTTMILGVYFRVGINSYLIDAIIGLSVVYKALDNLGAFSAGSACSPTPRPRPWSSGCSTASAWRPRSSSTRSRPTGWCPTCWPSTSAWRSASCWRWRHPDRDELLAPHAELPAPRLHRQRRHDEPGLHARGLSADRLRRVLTSPDSKEPIHVQQRKPLPIKQQLAAEAAAEAAADAAGPRTAGAANADVAAPLPAPVTAAATPAAAPSPAAAPAPAPAPARPAAWRDELRFTLAPGEGIEIKLRMNEGARAEFAWAAEGGVVNVDTHGDGGGRKISYEKGRGVPSDEGELVAAFSGNHGWFWRNRGRGDVEVVLRTRGDYLEIKRAM